MRLDQHDFTLWELADLVGQLPAGCPFWQSFGGPKAWSDETAALLNVAYRMEVLVWQNSGGKGKRPEPPKPPPLAHEVEQQAAAITRATERLRARR